MFTKIIQRKVPTTLKFIPLILKPVTASHSTTSTTDSNEVIQFNKFDSVWWDELGEFKPLHSMNKLRVPFIRDGLINTGLVREEFIHTSRPLTDKLILEVGCGGGILAEPLARLGAIVTGIDVSTNLIDEARKHAKLDASLSNITYLLESVENYSVDNLQKYDAVVASEVVEHVTEKEVFLDACVKCVKPGGSIFITTLSQTLFSWLGAIILAENVLKFIPKGTHDWDKFITPYRTQQMLERYQCRTRVIHGMWYNYFSNTWSWTEDTSASYALQAVVKDRRQPSTK